MTASKGWYYSEAVKSQGIPSAGISNTEETTGYAFLTSQPFQVNDTIEKLYVNVDVRVNTIGQNSASDYFYVYLGFLDAGGKNIGQKPVTPAIKSNYNEMKKWVTLTNQIEVPTGARTACFFFSCEGTGMCMCHVHMLEQVLWNLVNMFRDQYKQPVPSLDCFKITLH